MNNQLLAVMPLVADLAGSLGSGVGLLEAIGLVAAVGTLIWAAIEAKRDRGLSSLGIAIICAIVMGAAFFIVQQAYKAGGSQSAQQVQQGNLQ